jgi:hypothetical protein
VSTSDKIFGKTHLIGAWWQVIVGLLLVIVTYLVTKAGGPQTVIVENTKDLHSDEPTIVRSTAELDKETKEQLRDVAASVKRLVESRGQERDRPLDPSRSEIEALKRQVQELTDLARGAAISTAPRAQTTDAKPTTIPLSSARPLRGAVSIIFPATPSKVDFAEPESAQGYMLESLTREVSGLRCPSPVRKQDSTITLSFSVRDESARSRISPLYLSVASVDAPLQQTQIYGTYVPVDVGQNAVVLEANLGPGNYTLTAGYYLMSKLSGAFPSLHGVDCPFSVK